MAGWLPTIKSRTFSSGREMVNHNRANGFAAWDTVTRQLVVGKETIVSQCHLGDWKGHYFGRDVGGEMSLTRAVTRYIPTTIGTPGTGLVYGDVWGGFFTQISTAFPVGSHGHNDAQLSLFGTRAIVQVAPTNPQAHLATLAGELKKDGLPRFVPDLLKSRTDFARKAGSDYLNIEFGWLPLVSDVKELALAVVGSRKILDQYVRDSGRMVRRRFGGPPLIDTAVQEGGGFLNPAQSNIPAYGWLSESRKTFYWYKGAFVYHIPAADTFMGEFRRMESLANHLLGSRITPEVLWELAPWSWLSDWFVNVGELLHNISVLGTDGLVQRYGYAMRHQVVESQYRFASVPTGSFPNTIRTGMDVRTEYKRRIRANPYGFGVTYDGLTARQLAILAALGLSQGRRDGNRHDELWRL